jgi:hypothetical protein
MNCCDSSHGLQEPAGEQRQSVLRQRRAKVRLYFLLFPTFLKILWFHFTSRQGSQFAHLGQSRGRNVLPLSPGWASWAANKIARLVLRTPILRRRPCYWRSQVIYDLLPRFGFPAQLHLGAQLDGDKPATHLWVSMGGRPLAENPDCAIKYVELAVYNAKITHD